MSADPTISDYRRPDNAERAVLGAMLLSPRCIDDIADVITGSDYHQPAHETVHDAILAVHLRGTSHVDVISVGDELARTGDLVRIGGQSFLHQLVDSVPTAANGTYYANEVRNASLVRAVVTTGIRFQAYGDNAGTGTDVLEIVNAARSELDQLASADPRDRLVDHASAVYDAIDQLEASPGSPTPWEMLTNTIAGWKPGCLYLIGARPGVGKSVAGIDIALDTARRGHAALFYSLEMSRTELYHRLLAHVGSVDMGRIQHRRLTADDWTKVAHAGQHLSDLPLHVDDRAALSLAQIRASVRAQQRKHQQDGGRGVGVVIVDYLQLIAPPVGVPHDDRRVQVDAISRGLKNLAKDVDVPVIALTQLNRASEQRADKTPSLSDMREAGGQEQDADVVILMHRDLNPAADDNAVLRLLVAKNRHGPQTSLELSFQGAYSRIEERSWSSHSGRTIP